METILAIGAHPDDIEIDCAGSIARAINQGSRVLFYVLTNGNKGGNAEIRKREALRSAEILGVEDVIFDNSGDCTLRYDPSLVIRIKSVIIRINPNVIYTHSKDDISTDHAEVGRATLLASSWLDTKEILAYRGTPQFQNFKPNYFIDIEKFLDLKEKALRVFESQNVQDKLGLEYITANAAYYGRMANMRYAEAFKVVRYRVRDFTGLVGT